ncbi:hypothetical protein HY968_03160 [Candidatus Kaiserbacteria bacterium]|nr:hypothetical protein [Candidatus Kaiserbacteria bacterium]
MTKLLDEAIEKVRRLPQDRQMYAAEVLETIASQSDEKVYRLSPEERTDVRAALAEIERGEFATEKEMEALWKKCGL